MGEMRFILGRAGCGKTCACLDLVAQELKHSPIDGPAVILLVPEQATFQMSRQLAGWNGLNGYIRAKVLSFKKLAMSVVSETHGRPRPMLGVSRKLLMQQIITSLRNDLRFWNGLPPERIAGSLLKLLDELGQARLDSAKLAELAERLQNVDSRLRGNDREREGQSNVSRRETITPELSAKLADLIRLGKEYERMDRVGLDDPGKYLEEYRELIGQIPWLKDATIFVDGFSGFSGQEYAALLATAGVAKEMSISLTLEPSKLGKEALSDEDKVFQPNEDTYFRLIELAKSAGIKIDEPIVLDSKRPRRFEHSPTLMAIENILSGEKSLFRPDPGDETVMIVSAENPAHEVELAAGKILQLVREKGWRFRDISVILRNLEGYEHLLRYGFDHFNIPYFLDVRRPIGQHPVTRLILSAVGAIAGNFKTEWMRRYVKTGLTGLDEQAADRVENYVLAHGIDADRWLEEWKYKLEFLDREDQPENGGEIFDLRKLNDCRRELLIPLEKLEKAWGIRRDEEQDFSVDGLLSGLTDFLKGLEIPKKLSELSQLDDLEQAGQIHQQILNVVMELFDQLRLTLADRLISLEEFLTILTESFAELSVGVIPSNVDQVLIGTIERSRHPAVKASLVLGFNEGSWPSKPEDDVVLTDQDRETLAWQDLAVKGDIDQHYLKEQYLMYIALTRASDYLWISSVRKDASGNSVFPSRYLRRVQRYLSTPTRVVPAKEASLLWNSGTPSPITRERLVCEVLNTIGGDDFDEPKEETILWRTLAAILKKRKDTAELLQTGVEGLCDENSPTLESGLAKKLYQNKVSFSEIESFYRCPFQHFCKYGLRLRELPRFKLEPIDLGSFRHEVMKLAWQTITKLGEDWNARARQQVHEIVHSLVEETAKKVKDQLLFRNARNEYILRRTETELAMAVEEELRMLSPGKFKPEAFEKVFSLKIHQCDLVGRIDRIDFAQVEGGKWAMIVDYKSGQATFKVKDWWEGVQMQLPGYLMVTAGDKAGYLAGGGLYLPLRPKPPKNNGHESMVSYFYASGLINAETLTHLANTGEGIYPYGIKVNKDGEIASSSPVGVWPWQTIEGVLKKTYDLVAKGVTAMSEGKIEIRPYYDGHVSVCPMCEMRSVCRFNHRLNHYRGVDKLTREEILAKVNG